MQGSSALIRSHLHLFFYLISADRRIGGGWEEGEIERGGVDSPRKVGGKREKAEAEKRTTRRRFLALRWQTITGLPHKLDCRSVQMYVAINPAGKNNGDSFCKWRKT